LQREADRLDLQHHVLCLTYASKLYFAPVENPQYCLDVGTGTGIWAIDMGRSPAKGRRANHSTDWFPADQNPQCQVIGIDLSPGQPTL
jgi:ubiquinone/menaquinone biosynthesis C-methylase UbiE